MKKIFPIFLIVFVSCYGSKTVNHVARKNGLKLREVGGIDLFDGQQNIDTRIFDKNKSVYLFYKNDSLKFLSTEKTISNGDYLYRLETVGDSLYMLTRKSHFRYWYEDTVLFHSNYVVSNHCVFENSISERRTVFDTYFASYHFVGDSMVQYQLDSRTPVISIHQYGRDEKVTGRFLKKDSIQRNVSKETMRNFISNVLQ